MFKVRAVVVDFLGDKEKYPCHHQHKLGDEFTFDGSFFHGGICPSFAKDIVPLMMDIHASGPRYKDYIHYYPFLYAPLSLDAPELKKYDGLGFKNVFTSYKEPKYSVANLAGSGAFKWPPPDERPESRPIRLICPDYRTSVAVKIEAYDLADTGRNIPFYRREMSILDKVLQQPGIKATAILGEFTQKQIEGIYPALSQVMIESLLEEIELMGYVALRGGKVYGNKKAGKKLKDYKAGLSAAESKALGM